MPAVRPEAAVVPAEAGPAEGRFDEKGAEYNRIRVAHRGGGYGFHGDEYVRPARGPGEFQDHRRQG